jgi:hypothetical protein
VTNDDRIDLSARTFPPDVGIDDMEQVYAYGVLYAARALWEESCTTRRAGGLMKAPRGGQYTKAMKGP